MQQTCSRSKKEYGIQEKFKITYNNKKLFQVFHVPTWCFHTYKTWQFFQLKCMWIVLAIQIMCTKCAIIKFSFFVFKNGSMGRDWILIHLDPTHCNPAHIYTTNTHQNFPCIPTLVWTYNQETNQEARCISTWNLKINKDTIKNQSTWGICISIWNRKSTSK